MKDPSLQLAHILSAYETKYIIGAFRIWNEGLEKGLLVQGWYKADTKPTDREFFDVNGAYWVQDKPLPVKAKIRPVSPFMKRVKEFLSAKLGPRVIESVYQERLKSCGYGLEKEKQCEHLKDKEGKFYCGACGCGFRKEAELSVKLRMSRVECPRIPPLFKKIDEEKQKELLL